MTTDNRTNEPTEAQVEAACDAFKNHAWGKDPVGAMRAALVAAQGAAPPAGGRPKRLLNQLNRIADALEEYVFEGVAADAPAWMRKAAEYIESERQWRAPVLPSSGVDEDKLAEVIATVTYAWSQQRLEFWRKPKNVEPPGDLDTFIARAVAEWLKGQGGESRGDTAVSLGLNKGGSNA